MSVDTPPASPIPALIPAPLAEALSKKGYEALTPVQEAVLDAGIGTADLLVSAQTGSGKTVAFGLALAPSLLNGAPHLPLAQPPLALIIAPTRELALQVTKELQWLYAIADGQLVSCVGGMDIRQEQRALGRGAHIVVGTPGRLADHIRRGSLEMSGLKAVVLDEADEMLDMGFREELEEILNAAPQERRTLMFSATVSKPIARLAQNFQKDAIRLNTVSAEAAHIDIDYQALSVVPTDIDKAIINLLLFHDAPSAIIFCSRREAVNKLTARLNNRGFSVVALSGEFSQKERTNSLLAMRDGRARVCVATDVAARGIDLPGLDLVIHADLPRNKEALLHRSGRTGRAGRKGVCALIVPVRARARTERLLREANVDATWRRPPSAQEIKAALDERLLHHDAFNAPADDEETDSDLIGRLLDKYPPEQLAAAVLRLTRSKDSAPEDLQTPPEGPSKKGWQDRAGAFDPNDDGRGRGPKRQGGRRSADFADGAWVKLSVGRKKKADPKWLVPMLCKAGGFSRQSIGAIQINTNETFVELKPGAAAKLITAAGPKQSIDKGIAIDIAEQPHSPQPYKDKKGAPERRRAPKKRGSTAKPTTDARQEAQQSPDESAQTRPARPPHPDKKRPAPRKKKPTKATKNAKRPRQGPKKPRGPNGEKKRSKKKS